MNFFYTSFLFHTFFLITKSFCQIFQVIILQRALHCLRLNCIYLIIIGIRVLTTLIHHACWVLPGFIISLHAKLEKVKIPSESYPWQNSNLWAKSHTVSLTHSISSLLWTLLSKGNNLRLGQTPRYDIGSNVAKFMNFF